MSEPKYSKRTPHGETVVGRWETVGVNAPSVVLAASQDGELFVYRGYRECYGEYGERRSFGNDLEAAQRNAAHVAKEHVINGWTVYASTFSIVDHDIVVHEDGSVADWHGGPYPIEALPDVWRGVRKESGGDCRIVTDGYDRLVAWSGCGDDIFPEWRCA